MGVAFNFDYRRGGPLPPMQSIRLVVIDKDTGQIVPEHYPALLDWNVDWMWIEPHMGNTELRGHIMLTAGALNLRNGKYTATVLATFPNSSILPDASTVTLQVRGGK